MILNVWFKPCPWVVFLGEKVAFTYLATLLQRYELFLKYPNYFANIFQKFANLFVSARLLTEMAKKLPQNACIGVFLTFAWQAVKWALLELRHARERSNVICLSTRLIRNFSGREPQHLSILSASRLLLRSSFSPCYFCCSIMVRYSQVSYQNYSSIHLFK